MSFADNECFESEESATSPHTLHTPSTPASEAPPSLLTIPIELRLLILKDVLVSPYYLRHVGYSPTGPQGRCFLAAILSCNRQLYRDSLSVLYKHNTFTVVLPIIRAEGPVLTEYNSSVDWAKLPMSRVSLEAIRHMKIDAGPLIRYTRESLLVTMLSTLTMVFPQVQTVTLHFHGIARDYVESIMRTGNVRVALVNFRRLVLPDIIVTGLCEEAAELVTSHWKNGLPPKSDAQYVRASGLGI